MDLVHILLLLGAGLAGGILSTLLGGASLVTFPAFLAAGLSPVVATATNMAALTPGGFLAVLTDLSRLPKFDRAFWFLILCSGLGTLAGAVLLMLTPGRLFEKLIPLLLGLATLLFACSGRVSAWVRTRAMARHGGEPRIGLTSVPMLLAASVYNGYFGAGTGVMLLAVLSIWSAGDYRTANVTKNFVANINSFGAAVIFALQGAVDWKAAGILGAGALVGSLLGGHAARFAPAKIIHPVVVGIGILLTIIYAWRYWL